jgi:two-component system cell cycle sensor histidine kinase/response regulator CckA
MQHEGADGPDEVFELGEAVLVVDPEFRVRRVNRAQERISRRPREETLGRTVWELWPGAADPERASYRAYHRCMRERVTVHVEESYYAPLDLWIKARVEPLRDGGIAIYFQDISEQRRAERALSGAEEALADQKELLRAIIDGTPSLISAFDAEGKILFVNETTSRFHGLPKEALIGKDPTVGLRPEDAARVSAAHRRVMATGEGHTEEIGGIVNGTARSVLASRYPLRNASGRIYGTATVATDITAQKQVERELRESEERAREALAALEKANEVSRRTEERLRQVQKMEAVGQLAGGVAHDFNNLLTVILGNVEELLERLRPGDPVREPIEEIDSAGKRAADLTRQLLAFSRRQVLEPRTVALNDLVRGADRMLRRLIGEDVELTLALSPQLDPCLLDPSQLEQILMNLVVNARDAMPRGGQVLVETANVTLDAAYAAEHPEVTPGPYVRLTVSDTGTGIAPEVRARIFEPFFTTKQDGDGTGLGLSTVYGIVRQSGGSIWVYSEPGQGTVFKIYFPSTAGRPVRVGEHVPAPVTTRGTETILLVEDDDQVRAVVASMLRRGGYHVLQASNGGEALLLCEEHPLAIHLLLTDVVMPKLNGRKLAERLRRIRPELRVIFMSGYTENAIVHHGVLDPGIDFLPKPVASQVLLTKVREVLDRA